MVAVAKLPAEGVRVAVGVMPGFTVAEPELSTGSTGPVWGMRILVLVGPPGFSEISRASGLPLVGVLCAVRGVAPADDVTGAPGVVAVPLISDPVCESSCRSTAVGTVTVLHVTTVGADSAEVA